MSWNVREHTTRISSQLDVSINLEHAGNQRDQPEPSVKRRNYRVQPSLLGGSLL
jgi:hypothetical protein